MVEVCHVDVCFLCIPSLICVWGVVQGECLKCVVSCSCRQLNYWLITGASVSGVALSVGLSTAQTLTWQDSNAIFPVGLVRTWFSFFFFFPFFKHIYLFIFGCAESWLQHAGFSLVATSRGLLFTAAQGLLVAVASPVAEHTLQGIPASAVAAHGFTRRGSRALSTGFSSSGAQA